VAGNGPLGLTVNWAAGFENS